MRAARKGRPSKDTIVDPLRLTGRHFVKLIFWRLRRSFRHARAKSSVLTQEPMGRNDFEKRTTTVNSVMLDCV